MNKEEIFREKLSILRQEWSMTQDSIFNLDDMAIRIRGWAITLCAGGLGYSYINQQPALSLYIVGVVVIFWVLDATFKSAQRRFIRRDREIREYFASSNFDSDILGLDFERISISKSFVTKEAKHGWTANSLKHLVKAMFLRNVFSTYASIIAGCIVLHWLIARTATETVRF